MEQLLRIPSHRRPPTSPAPSLTPLWFRSLSLDAYCPPRRLVRPHLPYFRLQGSALLHMYGMHHHISKLPKPQHRSNNWSQFHDPLPNSTLFGQSHVLNSANRPRALTFIWIMVSFLVSSSTNYGVIRIFPSMVGWRCALQLSRRQPGRKRGRRRSESTERSPAASMKRFIYIRDIIQPYTMSNKYPTSQVVIWHTVRSVS